MSIKPIDFHLTYASSVKESRVKQNDLNRPRENEQYLQVKTSHEIEKKLRRAQSSEETNKKNISKKEKDRGSNNYKGKKRQHKENENDENKDTKPIAKKGIGDKFDIMI